MRRPLVRRGEGSLLSVRRRLFDRLTRALVTAGGIAVAASVALLFGYLLTVVWPLFESASVGGPSRQAMTPASTRLLRYDDSGQYLLRLTADGTAAVHLADAANASWTGRVAKAIAIARPLPGISDAVVLQERAAAQDQLRFLRLERNEGTDISLYSLFGGTVVPLDTGLLDFDGAVDDGELLVAQLAIGTLRLQRYLGVDSAFPLPVADEVTLSLATEFHAVRIGPRSRSLWLLGEQGVLAHVDLGQFKAPVLERFDLGWASQGLRLTAFTLLSGRYSLLLARSDGVVEQRFLVPGASEPELLLVRKLDSDLKVRQLLPERRRKGFVALGVKGAVRLGHATTGRWVTAPAVLPELSEGGGDALEAVALDPGATRLAALSTDGALWQWPIRNRHPEISLAGLFNQLWYEGYSTPQQSWQSSAGDDDFEPKLSLVPLMFGTLKAAVYALVFAVPLAVMGALYTACFMAPGQRAVLKPAIEVMAALPTVVLGFIAGLWLAPVIERSLSSVLSLLVLLPAGTVLVAVLWQALPASLVVRLRGSAALVSILPILLIAALAVWLGPQLEGALFAGNSAAWLERSLGLEFDQRNALVVGIAMGFAVIPTIFTIAEDAIYSVPAHLANGARALGATPWQTAVQVILPTAGAGVLSAIIVGFGRAIGETMIVLMATGNTPIMDWNLFEGMRTLAANIAVELPEAEVDSTHYRVLFLSALTLFVLTFAFNTVAEFVRARLRVRYSEL